MYLLKSVLQHSLSVLLFPHYRSAPNPFPFPLLVSAGAHPGLWWRWFGLVPQLAAKTCSLQLLSAQLIALPSCCALPEGCSGSSQLWAYLLSHAKPAPKPGPWCWCTGPPASPPKRSCHYSPVRASLASSVLWSRQRSVLHSTGLALSGCEIPLKPRGLLLSRGKHAEGLSGLRSYILLMSGRRKMEIFSMSLFAL